MSASSLSSQVGYDDIFIFKTIIPAKEKVKDELSAVEWKNFQSIFKNLEDAVTKGTIASSKDAITAITRLETMLVRNKGKTHIDNFFKKIKKLRKALESGSSQGNAFKFVKMDNSQNPSPIHEAVEFEARDNNRRALSTFVNQWLTALKTDIEKGQCTSSFEGDTGSELAATKEILQDIAQSLTNNWKKEQQLREDLKSQQHEMEKFITVTKQSSEKQTREIASLEAELVILENEIEDLSKQKIIQKNKVERPSQRIKDISQAIQKWKDEDKRQTQETASLEAELEKLEKEIEDLSKLKIKKVYSPSQRVKNVSQTIKKWRNEDKSSQKNASETQRMHEMASDELRSNVTDVCAFCATDGKLNPALYFCKDCSKFGRYICGICNKSHGRFTNNHNVERTSTT